MSQSTSRAAVRLHMNMHCTYERAEGTNTAQVVKAVFMNRKLKWPAGTPVKYRKLAAACMAYDPEDRPMFSECVEQLHDMWAMYDRCGD